MIWTSGSEPDPYTPGAGRTPPALVGRDSDIAAFDLMVARSRMGRTSRSIVLHGLRGVGKTVLLNNFRDQAERASWLIVELEGRGADSARTSPRKSLGRALILAGRELRHRNRGSELIDRALGSVASFSITLGVSSIALGVTPALGRADSGDLDLDFEELISDLGPILREKRSALAVFVDEMQDLEPELLVALLTAQHRAQQREWPFYLVGAGLPPLPSVLSATRSYAERLFDFRMIGSLDSVAAAMALVDPATRIGLHIDDDAASTLLSAAGGYPYFIQTFGEAMWNIAVPKRVRIEDARNAVARGIAMLDAGFYPARWDRASSLERAYLRAMSADGDGPVRISHDR